MQQYGFCNLSCLAVRADASHKSEMVNQLLFGETFQIIDQFKTWKLIRGVLDNYEGFVDDRQIFEINEEQFLSAQRSQKRFPFDVLSKISREDGGQMWITPAASLEMFDNSGNLTLGKLFYKFHGQMITPPATPTGNDITQTALKYLDAPYLWGGRTPFGIDCSGLVQNVFKINGFAIPRDASQQVKEGMTIFLNSESQPGDVAFFENEQGEIVHTGIILSNDKIIHASGSVRIDSLDHNGIFNGSLKKYTHKLRIIKRLVPGN